MAQEFKLLLLQQHGQEAKEQEFIDEITLKGITTIDQVNEKFDVFDPEIAEPNSESIKYEISNDGAIVMIVIDETGELVEKVRKFFE